MNKTVHNLLKRAKKTLAKNDALRETYHFVKRSLRPRYVKKRHNISYRQWIRQCEPLVWSHWRKQKLQPQISVVVPAFNDPEKYLKPLINSLKKQTYDNWQLCIADGSTDEACAEAMRLAANSDKRIVYKRLAKNEGIVGNTNQGIKLATGEFVGFLDQDDELAPQALYEVVVALNEKPKTDFFYSDEDKISDDGSHRSLPFFKPDFSPTLLEGVNYITHFSVVRRSLLKKIGNFRKGFDGAQDYDLILRITDATDRIVHIPKILYHWRLAEGSTSGPIENKPYATAAGMRALEDHVQRKKIPAKVLEIPELPTNYRLQYKTPRKAKVSIIIPFKDKPELLKKLIPNILNKTTYKNYEIILISNNSEQAETHSYLASLKSSANIKIFEHNISYNYSALNNFGRSKASGDYLVLLNNDTEVITGDWLKEMLGVASQPWAGAVGPALFYPNNTLQHAGIILGMDTVAGHIWRHLHQDALTPFGRPYWPRDFLAVTAACLMVKASKYDEIGGFDENLVVAGNDVAFCLRLHEKGYRNIYWPFVRLYHYENASVGTYQNAPPTDYDNSMKYYKPYLLWHDPYFNPNLSLQIEQIAYREDYSGSFN